MTEITDLEAEREQLEIDLSRMRMQIQQAKADAEVNGRYSDSDWFARVNAALRMTGIDHQRVLRQLAELKRAKKLEYTNSYEKAFIAACRRRLDPALYDEIVSEARDNAHSQVAS